MPTQNRNHPDPVRSVQSLFIRHTAALRGYVLALVPDLDRAEDIVQEVFLVVTDKAADFEPGSDFLAWVTTIARFKVLESFRSAGRQAGSLSPAVVEALAACAPTDGDAEPAAVSALTGCLDELAPRARQVIDLRYRDNLKPAAIAKKIDWTAPAVSTALSRARASLRKCVEARLSEEGKR